MWPVVTVHEHSILVGHYPAFACIGPEVFLAAPAGIETGAVTHEVARSRSVIPAHAGIQRSSETAPHSAPSDAWTPHICTGNASKHALTAHLVHPCGDRQNRQPSRQRRHSRACGNPEVVRNRPPFSALGCPDAPYVHRNCTPKCTDCARRAPHGTQRDRQPAIEMRHSRACGNPAVVRNRPSFSAIGYPDAPYLHRK